MCTCVGAGKSRERKGQGYNNNDVQVHLGALLEFITALFKYNSAPFFFLTSPSFTPVTYIINVKQGKRRRDY